MYYRSFENSDSDSIGVFEIPIVTDSDSIGHPCSVPYYTNRGHARVLQREAPSDTQNMDADERGEKIQWNLPSI